MNYSEALEYCYREIKQVGSRYPMTCYDCYWIQGAKRCEINGELADQRCWQFMDDVAHGNNIKEAILYNPNWCLENWNLLNDFDRQVFHIINDRRKNNDL